MFENILKDLKSEASEKNVLKMKKFGINTKKALGVFMPEIRLIAKKYPKSHELAKKLWETDINESKILASLVDEPQLVTEHQMNIWVKGFDSWDVCDQCCNNLFSKTPYAYKKALDWSKEKNEFVKRAGFVLMANLAVHDKKSDDKLFVSFLPIIKEEAKDNRNFVKKSVNWALRQIGKRNYFLNKKALEVANDLKEDKLKSSLWISSNAIKELTSEKVQKKLLA